MARGINKVILVGNLGRDPEIRYTPSGSAIANVTVATSESWKDRNTGEQQERTEWHRVVFFNRLAEIVGEYLNKGSQIYIEGKLQTRKWQDQSGADRYTTEIVANEMQMLGGRGQGGGMGGGQGGGMNRNQGGAQGGQGGGMGGGFDDPGFADPFDQPRQNQGGGRQQQPQQQQKAPQTSGAYDDFDDDIPF